MGQTMSIRSILNKVHFTIMLQPFYVDLGCFGIVLIFVVCWVARMFEWALANRQLTPQLE